MPPEYHSFQVVTQFWQELGKREEETYSTPYIAVLNWLSFWHMRAELQK
jgi:hypothetical protein